MMASGFRNEDEMRSAQFKPLIDSRKIKSYRKTNQVVVSFLTRLLFVTVLLLWLILGVLEHA